MSVVCCQSPDAPEDGNPRRRRAAGDGSEKEDDEKCHIVQLEGGLCD